MNAVDTLIILLICAYEMAVYYTVYKLNVNEVQILISHKPMYIK